MTNRLREALQVAVDIFEGDEECSDPGCDAHAWLQQARADLAEPPNPCDELHQYIIGLESMGFMDDTDRAAALDQIIALAKKVAPA